MKSSFGFHKPIENEPVSVPLKKAVRLHPMRNTIMRNLLFLVCLSMALMGCSIASQRYSTTEKSSMTNASPTFSMIEKKRWAHGSKDCETNDSTPLDILKLDSQTFILRQNKCDTFEAPFMYLLLGADKALLFDTGAIEDPNISPVAIQVDRLIQQYSSNPALTLIVLHSHGHADHKAGDVQFMDKNSVTVASSDVKKAAITLGFNSGFSETQTMELGNREISIIPTPGHHADAITIYDEKHKLLLTGDTLYPGLIYVKNWDAYKESVSLLYTFSEKNDVAAVLGGHIEMSREPFVLYPIGSSYQPNELPIPLQKQDIDILHKALKEESEPKMMEFKKITVQPMNWFQRTLSNIFSLFF
ncbi:MAG: MBL fold metallo-hydrolase [Kangiellaceae bacterium]|nr:MBL fold metallo-hydrolase [Kangiellaceae bacterium]